ncbi:OmpA family protein [Leptospira paudalimensis]|uniref:OmpA family protein n=1 Tax=Leptospira paudalimensis TaxID=2950024 RepID=A0ABT3M936_9LEPT|nr:OmpA family protein [Leptospira paudalimensis]MCW7504709.1 OmpA family protein [Leptospira paudalimensis]
MQKWKQNLVFWAILIFPFYPGSFVWGQGFDKGNFILYGMGMGGVGNNSGSIQKAVFNRNFPNYLVINSPFTDTTSRYLLYEFYSNITEDRTRLSSRGGEVGFEYGLFRYFGLGLSVSNQVITSSYFQTVDNRVVLLYSLLADTAANQLARLVSGDLYSYGAQRKRDVFNALSADLNFFIHFMPNQQFDPYFRFGGGTGAERLYGGNTNRVFGSLGIRYHFNHLFFISSEVEHANVYMVNYEAPSAGYRNKGNYEETAIKFGLGFSFGSNPEPVIREETPKRVIDSIPNDDQLKTASIPNESKLERFVFFASEIFDLPSSRIHLEGRARLDAIARSLENEFKEYDILIITYTSPYKEDLPGNFENYDLGFERAQAISRVLREKGVSPRRIIDSTQGSALYTVESKEKVVIELRKKVK